MARTRLVLALLLLALYPCARYLTAKFLSSQSGRSPRIEFILDDLAIQSIAFSRREPALTVQVWRANPLVLRATSAGSPLLQVQFDALEHEAPTAPWRPASVRSRAPPRSSLQS
jgi:hypothetical protein